MNNNQRTNNWFLDQLNVFQAANSDYQSIKDNFIIRKNEFLVIIDGILNKKTNDPLQHELILGRRGSGKSTLLKRIEIEIIENKKLNNKFIPINLAEEQAGIYRLFDLWEQVLEELKHQLDIEIRIKEYASFNDNQEYTRYLYAVIHETCIKNKMRIILLLDNFDRIVENFTDDGSLLREILINYNDIQIIAGSTRMDEHFWKHDMPFYEFFRRHRLEALSRDEITTLLNHWSNSLGIPALKDFVKNNPGKIENIRILTDGLPRTLQFFIQIVLQQSETNTYDYLKKTMDNVSPLFQERLNSLPAQLRKTVLEMSFIWEACTTKQLVEKTKMESKLISANLNTLIGKGILEKLETQKKQHLYRISERFFNMWLIITQGNPEQKRKAKWLSIFLENWYDANDFKRLANEHIKSLKSGKTSWDQALVLSKALSQSKYISLDERDTIIELTESIKCKGLDHCMIELPERYRQIEKKINIYFEEKNYTKAIEITETIENEADGIKNRLLGIFYYLNKEYSYAEENFQKAIKLGNTSALYNLALLYKDQEKFSEAEKYYLMAIEFGNDDALFNLAILYNDQEKFSEAEKYYLMAIEKGDTDAFNNLALLYIDQERFHEAEKYFLMAIEKGDVDSLSNLALFYEKQEKFSEAEKYYLMAIEKGEKDSIFNLAILYNELKKFSEAEKYFLMAIEKGDIDALNNLALLFIDQGKFLEAEKYFLMAIEKGNIKALNNLGIFYEEHDKFLEAEKYLILALEKGNISTLFNLGLFYQNQKKIMEAEKFYLMAIEKGDVDALNNLGLLYIDQEKFSEAEKYFLMAIEKGETGVLNNLALLYKNQGKYLEAEKYLLMAIEKGNMKALNNLAIIYEEQEKHLDAEKYYIMAIEKGETGVLNNLALLYRNQERFLEAEKYYLMAIEKGEINALNNLGLLYNDQGKFLEAEKYYLMAIEKGEIKALNNLGLLYNDQGKFLEAEKYFLMAIEKGNIKALNNLAALYDDEGKFLEAEKYYLMAIEKGNIKALNNLAALYDDEGKFLEAEKYYLMAIEKGDNNAVENLAILYYSYNANKLKSLELINQVNEIENDIALKENQLIIELWNGIFNDVENRIIDIAKEKDCENLEEFIFGLLVQQQKVLVLRLFQNEEIGKKLQERHLVLYYVTLLLNKIQEENLKLRIPPELQSTIDDVLGKITERQQIYLSKGRTF